MGRTPILFFFFFFFFFSSYLSLLLVVVTSQSPTDLDHLLQDYAFRAFLRPRTGVPYDAAAPSNLSGILISAMRLRSGSLYHRGVSIYKDFTIPVGVVTHPYVERLVLVYQNLANWSALYYPLPGYTYLAPILGLLAYDASNLSATNLPELHITATKGPITIDFHQLTTLPGGHNSAAMCVWFDLHGLVNFTSLLSGNRCSTFQQGHFSIVAAAPPSPAPVPMPSAGGGHKSKVWIIVGSVIAGFALLILLGLLALWLQRYNTSKRMHQMEKAAEDGEALRMTSVGNTKAPAAAVTRTQPALETEYVP